MNNASKAALKLALEMAISESIIIQEKVARQEFMLAKEKAKLVTVNFQVSELQTGLGIDPAKPIAVAQVVAEPAPPKYGYCPMCFVPGIARDRQINGNDRCERGHVYKSTAAIASRPSTLSRDLEALIAPAICPVCNGTSADAFAACKITEGVKCPMGRLEFSARGVD